MGKKQTTPDVYGPLTAVSLDDPRTFVTAALTVLTREWKLEAASLFLSTPQAGILRLKAQVGFEYENYSHFEFPQSSFPGLAVARQQPVWCADPSSSEYFVNKVHLEGRPAIAGVVSIPLIAPPEPSNARGVVVAPAPMGALSLYPRQDPKHPVDLKALAEKALEYGPFLARLYLATLERHAMTFRQDTVRDVAFSNDPADLAREFTRLVQREVSVEACSLWLLDSRRNQLYLKHRTKAQGDTTPFSIGDPNQHDPVVRCFHAGKTLFHGASSDMFGSAGCGEDLDRELKNAALVPLLLPQTAILNGKTLPVAGVLGLFNHYTAYGDANHLTEFSWEDKFLSEFACEMVSVLIYQILRTRDYESDFERLMHGARTNLQAARTRLQFLDANEIGELLPGRQRHFIPNAIDWIEDLEAQINRDEMVGSDRLPLNEVSLYGAVLAKLGPMVKGMTERYGVADIAVGGLTQLANTYRELPRVYANRRALDCVFRNLLENCVKYSEAGRSAGPRIHISATSRDGSVFVRMEDNGIGIPPLDRESVFADGFRGATARARRPQGLGRGLHECQVLMRRMEGDIACLGPGRFGEGTAFEVRIPQTAGKGRDA